MTPSPECRVVDGPGWDTEPMSEPRPLSNPFLRRVVGSAI